MSTGGVGKELRDTLYEQAQRLHEEAISGRPIPMATRKEMKDQAAALRDQWMELEAARFNEAADEYKAAVGSVKGRLVKLRKELDDVSDAVKVVERATSVLQSVHRLLKLVV